MIKLMVKGIASKTAQMADKLQVSTSDYKLEVRENQIVVKLNP